MISDTTRVAWNRLLQKLLIGKTVTLGNQDAKWLLEIGASAVKWQESQGGPGVALRGTAEKVKRKKSVDLKSRTE